MTLLASTRRGAGTDDAAPSATRAIAASHGTRRQRRAKARRGRDRGCHRRLRLPEAAHRVRLRPNPYWMEAILPTVRCMCLPFAKLSQSSRHQHLSKNFLKLCLPSLYYFAYLVSTTVTLDLELINVSQLKVNAWVNISYSRTLSKKRKEEMSYELSSISQCQGEQYTILLHFFLFF